MMTRLQAKMPLNTPALWVGTFHGLCKPNAETSHHEAAGLPAAFAILGHERSAWGYQEDYEGQQH